VGKRWIKKRFVEKPGIKEMLKLEMLAAADDANGGCFCCYSKIEIDIFIIDSDTQNRQKHTTLKPRYNDPFNNKIICNKELIFKSLCS
jgi:hypothetical protein